MVEELALHLEPEEVVAVVGGLYHEILERIEEAFVDGEWIRMQPIEQAQDVLNSTLNAYLKAFNVMKGIERLDPYAIETFSFTVEQWRRLDELTVADSWEDLRG